MVALFTLTVTAAAGTGSAPTGRARVRLHGLGRRGRLRDRAVEAGQVEVAGEDGRGSEPDERQPGEQHAEDHGLPLVHVPTTQLPVALDLAHDGCDGDRVAGQHEHPRVQDGPLVQRRPDGAVEAVLEVQDAAVLDDVREHVAVERGVLREQRVEVQRALRGRQLVEPDLARRDLRPLLGRGQAMVRIGPALAHGLEDHWGSLSGAGPGGCDTSPRITRFRARPRSSARTDTRCWPAGRPGPT